MAALVAPGAASASLGAQCSGSNIKGQGSSLQKLAQGLWDPAFSTSADKYACNGTQGTKGTPKIEEYNPSGSGAGLKSWGVGNLEHVYGATNAYVGTDEPPNATQKEEIESNESTLTPKTLQTVPVITAAVSVIVHLPTGCTASSTASKGRLVLNNSTLEAIYRGTITKWSEITDDGDKLSGSGCNAETTISPVVRLDGSGTTHIFKKYLSLINSASFETTNKEGGSTGLHTWNEISEGPENTSWPTAAAVVRPSGTGGGKVVAKVAETPSSIGYANLADARANTTFIPPTGGEKTATFWVMLQNKGAKGETVTYADPSTDKDVAKLAESNCAKEEYTNGEVAFPPANTSEPWNEVTTKTVEPKYTLCGLSYDLAFSHYSLFASTTLEEATTVENFLRFVTDTSSTGGGQFLIKLHDYEPLTGTVLKEAQKGAQAAAF